MVDRINIPSGNYPPKSDEGVYPGTKYDKGGGPPRRDLRRSRSLGQNIGASALDGQLAAWDARTDDEEAETLVMMMKAYAFEEGAVNGVTAASVDPFSAIADTLLPNGVKQNLIVLAEVQWGHDGVNNKVVVNLGAAQIVKVPLGASYMRARARVSVRYFPRITVAAGPPANLTYLSADPAQRNNIFNNPNSPVLSPGLNFDATHPPPSTLIHVEGQVAKSFSSTVQGATSDRSSRAVRKFFGTFPTAAAAFGAGAGARVFCPIAFGASSVMLQTNPADFDNSVNVAGTLKFGMIDAAGNVIGEQPANQFVPLMDGCQQVFVYNKTANGPENPFALIYDMGL